MELYTDASSIGYGAVLVQIVNGRHHPVAYMSLRTTEVESRYHSYELETLAVVKAIKHFRQYLYGRKFKVITDCNALKASKFKKDLLPRIHRWWAFLQNYDFEIEYRKGQNLHHADFFSRNPNMESTINTLTRNTEWVQVEQRRDSDLRLLIDGVENYVLVDGVLKKRLTDSRFGNYEAIVVPKSFQWSLINSYHTALQHPGWEKTLCKFDRLLQRQTWSFGCISRLTKKIHVELIPNKNRATLEPIIQQNVRQNSYTMSFNVLSRARKSEK